MIQIKPLVFTGNNHQIRACRVFNYEFYVRPKSNGTWQWRWWDTRLSFSSWVDCDSEETAFRMCNETWKRILEPYLSIAQPLEPPTDDDDLPMLTDLIGLFEDSPVNIGEGWEANADEKADGMTSEEGKPK